VDPTFRIFPEGRTRETVIRVPFLRVVEVFITFDFLDVFVSTMNRASSRVMEAHVPNEVSDGKDALVVVNIGE
jgi:hypothetical protein